MFTPKYALGQTVFVVWCKTPYRVVGIEPRERTHFYQLRAADGETYRTGEEMLVRMRPLKDRRERCKFFQTIEGGKHGNAVNAAQAEGFITAFMEELA